MTHDELQRRCIAARAEGHTGPRVTGGYSSPLVYFYVEENPRQPTAEDIEHRHYSTRNRKRRQHTERSPFDPELASRIPTE